MKPITFLLTAPLLQLMKNFVNGIMEPMISIIPSYWANYHRHTLRCSSLGQCLTAFFAVERLILHFSCGQIKGFKAPYFARESTILSLNFTMSWNPPYPDSVEGGSLRRVWIPSHISLEVKDFVTF